MKTFAQLKRLAAVSALAFAALSHSAMGQTGAGGMNPPPVPENLRPPEGHAPYLKSYAVGTQNYVCLPGSEGPAWKFLGPQATLFLKTPWIHGEILRQLATHYLSANPDEGGTARPAWQSSFDTSTVWGKAVADSRDPQYVSEGAIPWLLVQVVGAGEGVPAGSALSNTTYIQRVNTSGGVAPATGCDNTTIGLVAFAPYTTDYIFYRANRRQ
jgi:hypothetical protein